MLAHFRQEQTPLLLNGTGMASRITTFYRRRDADDRTQLSPEDGGTLLVEDENDDPVPLLSSTRFAHCVTLRLISV